MSEILFESNYALLTYLKKEKILLLEWQQTCDEEEYKNIFNEALKVCESNNVQFFLSDLRKAGPVPYSSLLWLRNNVVPKAIEIEIKKVGLIFEERFYTEIYADSIRISLEDSNIAINYFSNIEDAKSWFNT